MVLADRFGRRDRNVADVTLRDALVIGCAQALALVPGTSRSGVTISAGRLLGFDRRDAARFSFLLSVPVILLATVYEMGGLLVGDEVVDWTQLCVAALVSAVVAYASIDLLQSCCYPEIAGHLASTWLRAAWKEIRPMAWRQPCSATWRLARKPGCLPVLRAAV
jgi:undecaprenyl pyrophosphate phosphatase UppP